MTKGISTFLERAKNKIRKFFALARAFAGFFTEQMLFMFGMWLVVGVFVCTFLFSLIVAPLFGSDWKVYLILICVSSAILSLPAFVILSFIDLNYLINSDISDAATAYLVIGWPAGALASIVIFLAKLSALVLQVFGMSIVLSPFTAVQMISTFALIIASSYAIYEYRVAKRLRREPVI
jgi:hypothetical protein